LEQRSRRDPLLAVGRRAVPPQRVPPPDLCEPTITCARRCCSPISAYGNPVPAAPAPAAPHWPAWRTPRPAPPSHRRKRAFPRLRLARRAEEDASEQLPDAGPTMASPPVVVGGRRLSEPVAEVLSRATLQGTSVQATEILAGRLRWAEGRPRLEAAELSRHPVRDAR
jgi:hypothetical protein